MASDSASALTQEAKAVASQEIETKSTYYSAVCRPLGLCNFCSLAK